MVMRVIVKVEERWAGEVLGGVMLMEDEVVVELEVKMGWQ